MKINHIAFMLPLMLSSTQIAFSSEGKELVPLEKSGSKATTLSSKELVPSEFTRDIAITEKNNPFKGLVQSGIIGSDGIKEDGTLDKERVQYLLQGFFHPETMFTPYCDIEAIRNVNYAFSVLQKNKSLFDGMLNVLQSAKVIEIFFTGKNEEKYDFFVNYMKNTQNALHELLENTDFDPLKKSTEEHLDLSLTGMSHLMKGAKLLGLEDPNLPLYRINDANNTALAIEGGNSNKQLEQVRDKTNMTLLMKINKKLEEVKDLKKEGQAKFVELAGGPQKAMDILKSCLKVLEKIDDVFYLARDGITKTKEMKEVKFDDKHPFDNDIGMFAQFMFLKDPQLVKQYIEMTEKIRDLSKDINIERVDQDGHTIDMAKIYKMERSFNLAMKQSSEDKKPTGGLSFKGETEKQSYEEANWGQKWEDFQKRKSSLNAQEISKQEPRLGFRAIVQEVIGNLEKRVSEVKRIEAPKGSNDVVKVN